VPVTSLRLSLARFTVRASYAVSPRPLEPKRWASRPLEARPQGRTIDDNSRRGEGGQKCKERALEGLFIEGATRSGDCGGTRAWLFLRDSTRHRRRAQYANPHPRSPSVTRLGSRPRLQVTTQWSETGPFPGIYCAAEVGPCGPVSHQDGRNDVLPPPRGRRSFVAGAVRRACLYETAIPCGQPAGSFSADESEWVSGHAPIHRPAPLFGRAHRCVRVG
jgi:hypothetical protein